jgi:hypothetical protein
MLYDGAKFQIWFTEKVDKVVCAFQVTCVVGMANNRERNNFVARKKSPCFEASELYARSISEFINFSTPQGYLNSACALLSRSATTRHPLHHGLKVRQNLLLNQCKPVIRGTRSATRASGRGERFLLHWWRKTPYKHNNGGQEYKQLSCFRGRGLLSVKLGDASNHLPSKPETSTRHRAQGSLCPPCPRFCLTCEPTSQKLHQSKQAGRHT